MPDELKPAEQKDLFSTPIDTNQPSPFAEKPGTELLKQQAIMVAAATALTPPPTPAETVPAPISQVNRLVNMLMELPEKIRFHQQKVDDITILYETRLSDLTFLAYSKAMFPPKKDGEPPRVASNDDERKLAVSQMLVSDERMKEYVQERNEEQNALTFVKNQFEAARIAAHLLAAQAV